MGGVITVCFAHLFGMRTPQLHALTVEPPLPGSSLSSTKIRALEYPFDGIGQVTPVAFEMALDKIEAGGR